VIRSVEPNALETRARLSSFALMEPGLMLRPWIGGISSLALERSFRSIMASRSSTADGDSVS
jgi:hypothetical protein